MSGPPPPNNPYSVQSTSADPMSVDPLSAYPAGSEGDATGGVIPYKNPKALLAYYLGIGGLFPVLGLPLGVAALVLGILGLKARKQNPAIRGSVHAWIGILLGVFQLLYNPLMIFGLIAAIVSSLQA